MTNLTTIKSIIGTTTLSDERLLATTEYFERKAGRITPKLHPYFVAHIRNVEKHEQPAQKFEAAMYGDDGSRVGRDTNDQGEPK